MSVVRIGLGQVSWAGDRQSQVDRLERVVGEAARRDAGLLAFPELCASPYFCETEGNHCDEYFESMDGPTVGRMSALARQFGMVLVVPVAEQDAQGNRYNSVAVLDSDGTLAGTYRKRHLPHQSGSWERAYFRPGENQSVVYRTAVGRVGVALCWDRFFPDTWQDLAQAQIVVVPVASQRQVVLVQPTMALLHTMFVATVNRTDEQRFAGGSFVAGPFGEIIGPFGSVHDELVIRSLDLDHIDKAREARCST